MSGSDVLYQDVLPGGSHWSFVVNAGVLLRLIDVEGGGNAAMLATTPTIRWNASTCRTP